MTNSISVKDIFQSVLILTLGAVIAYAILAEPWPKRQKSVETETHLPAAEPYALPIRWGDLGAKMVSVGVVDYEKFLSLYAAGSPARDEAERLLGLEGTGEIMISRSNANVMLNLLWGLGLGNRNPILTAGPMADRRYGGVDNFASVGGWTLSSSSAMDHYSMHPFVALSPEAEAVVSRLAENIYRPCCNNPALMPDCNHGMAMLGLLELMAAGGVAEAEMYRAALAANTLWFPDQYRTINRYLASRDNSRGYPDARELLGSAYSSSAGYQKIAAAAESAGGKSGSSCGV